MQSNESEAILQEIGNLLAEDLEPPFDSILLHAILAENMVGPSIFKDLGDHIIYRDVALDLLDEVLLDLWYTFPPRERWAEMEYLIRDGKFEVKYVYADEVAPIEIENSLDRRDRIVREYFGDKPIVYPPLEGNEGVKFEG
ncbi:hypothetical protein HZY97_01195 [Sphingomonas sp. R-74633]|uniref:hypothetical protein n=1 Tax=Sphingomonas sp. R-74633 TaxID=2751188 RepID=UPI0015D1802C|nr:hypothetical protein [Sphingomonas sp. R-74633]NYT39360.1 hypothetical protein [Sphingomonas sp. R-74633]